MPVASFPGYFSRGSVLCIDGVTSEIGLSLTLHSFASFAAYPFRSLHVRAGVQFPEHVFMCEDSPPADSDSIRD